MMGGGFGGWNRQGEFGQYATAASQQEILFGQHFGQINDRLTNIGNGICDSTFALNNAITTEGRNLSSQLANCCCEPRLGIANLSAQNEPEHLRHNHRYPRRGRGHPLPDTGERNAGSQGQSVQP